MTGGAVAAALGGGLALGAAIGSKRGKKGLGFPITGRRSGIEEATRRLEIGKRARQLGELTSEIQEVRKQFDGKASPLAIVLGGLTAGRGRRRR